MGASERNEGSEFGYRVAMRLANANTDEALRIFYALRKQRRLHAAVHEMNQLLEDRKHAELVTKAFRRVGLEHGG
jgi:hypothetical protein